MRNLLAIIIIFTHLVLKADDSTSNGQSCHLALNNTESLRDGLIKLKLIRTENLKSDEETLSERELEAVNTKLLMDKEIVPFNQRKKVSRILFKSGIFTSLFFGKVLEITLGSYSDIIKNQNSQNSNSVNIPYEDLAKSIYKQIVERYLGGNFNLDQAIRILKTDGKQHYDLTNIYSVISRGSNSNYPDESSEVFNSRAVILVNSIIDLGEENMILTLKEISMHVLGSIIEFQEKRKKNTDLTKNLGNKADNTRIAINNNYDETGYRGYLGIGLTLAAAITGFVNIEFSYLTFCEVITCSLFTGWSLHRIDYYTLYLSEKITKISGMATSVLKKDVIKDRIEHQLQDSTHVEKQSWLNWFRVNSNTSETKDERSSSGSSEILQRITNDIEKLKAKTENIELGFQQVLTEESNEIFIADLESVVEKTQEIMAITLMTVQNDLDFGVLSKFPEIFKKLSKAKNHKDINLQISALQGPLSQLNKNFILIDNLRAHINLLKNLLKSHMEVLSRQNNNEEYSDILDSMESSIGIFEAIQAKLMISQQKINFLKLNLSTLGNISNFKKIGILTENLNTNFEDLAKTFPSFQICLTGITDQCLSSNYKSVSKNSEAPE